MYRPFDFIQVIVFALAEWRISVLLARAARRRFTGRALKAARTAIAAFNVLLAIGFVFTSSEVVSVAPVPPRLAMILGAFTLGYLIAATVVLALYTVIAALRRQFGADLDPSRRRALNALSGGLLATPVAALGYGAFVERLDFRLREVDLPFHGLSPDLDGLRLLQLSDIHLSPFLSEGDLARVIDASNELRPHLTLITGDLITSRGDPLGACIRQLARLRSDAGSFGCLGNHERYARVEDLATAEAARAGIRFLRHQAQALRFGSATLNLAGVDFYSLFHKDRYLRGAEKLVAPGAFNLLLSHNPDVFPVAARQGYHLLLAGHTHGGQVTVEILDQQLNPARFFTPYVYGAYRIGQAAAYVTRGIGTIGIPARVGAPPEISLLRLRKVK